MTQTITPTATGEDLFHKVVLYLRSHPQEWNQSTWARRSACGTTMCFAGTTVVQAGFTLEFTENKEWSTAGRIKEMYDDDHDIDIVARKLLRISWSTTDELFYAVRFCEDCDEMVEESHLEDEEDHEIRALELEEYITHVSKITGYDFSNDFLTSFINSHLNDEHEELGTSGAS